MPILYTPDVPGVYKSEDIYNRAIDGDAPVTVRIVPAVRSLVTLPNNTLKMVISVDLDPHSLTYYNSTLGDVIFALADPTADILNYGTDKLMLYYDPRQSPVRIIVDGKLQITGENSIGYRIIRTDNEGNRVVISARLDINNNILSDVIPITDVDVNHLLVCQTGHTLFSISSGEEVTLEVLDSAGVVTITAQLTTKEATILNTLELSSNPIIGFDADCSQVRGDDWVIYLGQNIDELSIFPYLSFADGKHQHVTIDGMSTYMYGYESINNTFPGNQYQIVIKYFLGKDETSTINEDVDGFRFVTLTKNVVIDSMEKYTFSKVSVIPIWSTSQGRYSLRFVAYHETRNAFTDITSTIEYVTGFVFDPARINQQQEIHFTAPFRNPDGTQSDTDYNQTFFITVATPSANEPFLISETTDGIAYGAQNALYDRPRIYYDADIHKYFISSATFTTTAELLHNFYYAALPPWLPATETEPPVPTHFMVRDATTLRPLLLAPQALNDYDNAMTFLTLTAPANAYVNSTVVVEWLISTSNGITVLYSVPVEVLLSTVGYNG